MAQVFGSAYFPIGNIDAIETMIDESLMKIGIEN
jgi:hypothetical protein